MGVGIDGLRKKLRLLETYGPFGTMNEIAVRLNKRPNTVWGWADGSPGAAANSVPDKSFPALLQLFEEALINHASPERVKELLFGPAPWLENEFRKFKSPSIMALVENEADKTRFVFYREAKPNRGIIETNFEHETDDDAPCVAMGEWFRLVVERDLRGFDVLAIQNDNALWTPIPWQADAKSGYIFVPGRHENGELALMREQSSPGLSLFIVIATKTPIPSAFKDHQKRRITYDQSTLGAISDYFQSQSKKERRLFAINVQIGGD